MIIYLLSLTLLWIIILIYFDKEERNLDDMYNWMTGSELVI